MAITYTKFQELTKELVKINAEIKRIDSVSENSFSTYEAITISHKNNTLVLAGGEMRPTGFLAKWSNVKNAVNMINIPKQADCPVTLTFGMILTWEYCKELEKKYNSDDIMIIPFNDPRPEIDLTILISAIPDEHIISNMTVFGQVQAKDIIKYAEIEKTVKQYISRHID